jgi:histidine triad (HIT) family protein
MLKYGMEQYMEEECIFCKMAKGEVPVEKMWENDKFFCIQDKYPSAPIHLLVIPKFHVDKKKDTPNFVDAAFWGEYFAAVLAVVKQEKLFEAGYEIVNWGGGYQALDHEHIHIKAGHKVE